MPPCSVSSAPQETSRTRTPRRRVGGERLGEPDEPGDGAEVVVGAGDDPAAGEVRGRRDPDRLAGEADLRQRAPAGQRAERDQQRRGDDRPPEREAALVGAALAPRDRPLEPLVEDEAGRMRVVVGEDDERPRAPRITDARDHVPGRRCRITARRYQRLPLTASSATSPAQAAAISAGSSRAGLSERRRRSQRRPRARRAPARSSGTPAPPRPRPRTRSRSRWAIHSAARRSPGEQAPRSNEARYSTTSRSVSDGVPIAGSRIAACGAAPARSVRRAVAAVRCGQPNSARWTSPAPKPSTAPCR